MGIKSYWGSVKKYFVTKEKTFADVLIEKFRPGQSNLLFTGEFSIPRYPMSLRSIYDLAYNSDVLTTIHTALRNEIFRNGVEVVEAEDTDFDVTDNQEDTNAEDNGERQTILDFVDVANTNGQTLIEVCQELEDDLNIVDDAYGLFLNNYEFDNAGEVIDWILIEFIRVDPIGMQLVINKQNQLGFDENGIELLFDPEFRDDLIKDRTHGITGNRLMRAAYCHKLGTTTRYYSQNEVIHLMKYRPGIRHGYSPVITTWQKSMTLFAQDEYLLEYYRGKRPPKGMLVFNTQNKAALKDSWEDMVERSRIDPHLPGIMAVQPAGTGGKLIEWIDFMRSLDELQFVPQREEYRRVIGSVYHVSPVFQNDISTSGGLNNEGLQITVTNRGVEIGQKIYNDKLFPRIIKMLQVPGWTIQLRPSEEQDEMARLERIEKSLEIGRMASNMGLSVEYDDKSGDVKIESGEIEPMTFEFGGGGLPGKQPDEEGNNEDDDSDRPSNTVTTPKTPKAKRIEDIKRLPGFVDEVQNNMISTLTKLIDKLKKDLVGKIKVEKVTKVSIRDGLSDRFNQLANESMDSLLIEGQRLVRGKGREIALGTVAWLTSQFGESVNIRTSFDQVDENALDFFQKSRLDRISGVTEDLRNKIKNSIGTGMINGESEIQIANRIGRVMTASKARLKTIARTETKRVFDEVSLQRYQEAGVEKVEWLTAGDSKVRPSHAALQGNTWPSSSPRIPRDVLSEPNCRCILVPFIDSENESS